MLHFTLYKFPLCTEIIPLNLKISSCTHHYHIYNFLCTYKLSLGKYKEKKKPHEDLGTDVEIILKWTLK